MLIQNIRSILAIAFSTIAIGMTSVIYSLSNNVALHYSLLRHWLDYCFQHRLSY